MDNQQTPQPHSVADYRQQLIQTLTLILERERQWLLALEAHTEEVGKPLIDYVADHISILSDTFGLLTTDRYRSLLPKNEEVAVMIERDIKNFTEFSLASHKRLCTGINQALRAKGINIINFQPVF